jgi:hypothetical protein
VPEDSDDYLETVKRRKLATTRPSTLNEASKYAELQGNQKERILDDCPEPDADIPPLALLYAGFGRFFDFVRRAANEPSTFFDSDLKDQVDKLVDVMRGHGYEQAKQDTAQRPLLDILFPGLQMHFKHSVSDSRLTSDGHILAAHGGPLLVVEFKRLITMAEPQLSGYFLRLACQAQEDVLRGWRLPALGLIIRGEVRCLPARRL